MRAPAWQKYPMIFLFNGWLSVLPLMGWLQVSIAELRVLQHEKGICLWSNFGEPDQPIRVVPPLHTSTRWPRDEDPKSLPTGGDTICPSTAPSGRQPRTWRYPLASTSPPIGQGAARNSAPGSRSEVVQ